MNVSAPEQSNRQQDPPNQKRPSLKPAARLTPRYRLPTQTHYGPKRKKKNQLAVLP